MPAGTNQTAAGRRVRSRDSVGFVIGSGTPSRTALLADLPVPAQGLRSGRPAPAFRRLIMASTPPTASTASPSTTSAARNAPRRLPAVRRRLRTLGTGVRVWGFADLAARTGRPRGPGLRAGGELGGADRAARHHRTDHPRRPPARPGTHRGRASVAHPAVTPDLAPSRKQPELRPVAARRRRFTRRRLLSRPSVTTRHDILLGKDIQEAACWFRDGATAWACGCRKHW